LFFNPRSDWPPFRLRISNAGHRRAGGAASGIRAGDRSKRRFVLLSLCGAAQRLPVAAGAMAAVWSTGIQASAQRARIPVGARVRTRLVQARRTVVHRSQPLMQDGTTGCVRCGAARGVSAHDSVCFSSDGCQRCKSKSGCRCSQRCHGSPVCVDNRRPFSRYLGPRVFGKMAVSNSITLGRTLPEYLCASAYLSIVSIFIYFQKRRRGHAVRQASVAMFVHGYPYAQSLNCKFRAQSMVHSSSHLSRFHTSSTYTSSGHLNTLLGHTHARTAHTHTHTHSHTHIHKHISVFRSPRSPAL